MGRLCVVVTSVSVVATLAACRAIAPSTPPPSTLTSAVDTAVSQLRQKTARFAPTDLSADLTALPPNERDALAHLVRAAQVMDALFLEQVWSGNATMLNTLIRDESPAGKARLHAFLVNKGPWSRLDHHEAFVPGAPEKPPSANYYPAGSTKAEVEQWIASLGGAEKARATGFFTTIRRAPGGGFVAVPYSTEYQGELILAAQHLRAAAAATAQPTLKAFLESRANAFASNDYYESDVKWMELDATIEPTIGPYEVYEDEWFNYKAAFEAFITVKDRTESDKLGKFAGSLQAIEDNHTYSAIEEAKADIAGLFALQFLIDKGQLDPGLEKTIYTTFLASAFRSLRFGLAEAHGRGQAIQLNFLLDHGGFKVNADGTFAVDTAKIRAGVVALTRDIMTLQAEGSYAKARQMIDTLGVLRPPAKALLDKLTAVPVDIEPRFVTALDLLK